MSGSSCALLYGQDTGAVSSLSPGLNPERDSQSQNSVSPLGGGGYSCGVYEQGSAAAGGFERALCPQDGHILDFI